jgi:hypothetical protein
MWQAIKRWLHLGEYSLSRTFGAPRSSQWSAVRNDFLSTHKTCEACGTGKFLQVHHVKSFASEPALELSPDNFLVLCEGMERNCHRFVGHLNSWQSLNENSRQDAAYWLAKIQNRPTRNGTEWVYPQVKGRN